MSADDDDVEVDVALVSVNWFEEKSAKSSNSILPLPLPYLPEKRPVARMPPHLEICVENENATGDGDDVSSTAAVAAARQMREK